MAESRAKISAMPSLSDKLKSLGVKVGARDLQPQVPIWPIPPDRPAPPADPLALPGAPVEQLEQVLSGHRQFNAQGETFVVDTRYPLDYQHGASRLITSAQIRLLSAWAGDARLSDLDGQSFAYLDTETTGLSGGTGTYAFLIGVARYEAGEFHLAQFFMRDPAEEPAQLLALEEFLAPCQAIVTFNGKSFDIPLLNTRYLNHGWRTPFLNISHYDLLHLARRLWKNRLPSRTLGSLEVQILGAGRSEEDIPGWAIPQMYFDYLRSGDPTPLKNIFYHNAMDVVSLAALFNHLADLLADPLHAAIQHGVDLLALAHLYEDLGEIDAAIQLYLKGLSYEDNTESTIAPEFRLSRTALLEGIDRLAAIHKRREEFPAALSLWEKAARYQHLDAHVELSKYYEHRQRNYPEALLWVSSALEIVNSPGFPRYERATWLNELEPRQARLARKLSRSRST